MSSPVPEAAEIGQPDTQTMNITISVPSGKTKEMLTYEVFVAHFGPAAPCTVRHCRLNGPQPYMDNVNAVEMTVEFPDKTAADKYFEETVPRLRALGYELGQASTIGE